MNWSNKKCEGLYPPQVTFQWIMEVVADSDLAQKLISEIGRGKKNNWKKFMRKNLGLEYWLGYYHYFFFLVLFKKIWCCYDFQFADFHLYQFQLEYCSKNLLSRLWCCILEILIAALLYKVKEFTLVLNRGKCELDTQCQYSIEIWNVHLCLYNKDWLKTQVL